MPELSRSQVVVYGAIAIAVLLLGARWLRGGGDDGESLALASSGARGTGEAGAASGGGDGSAGEAGGGGGSSAEGFAFEPGGGDVVVHVAGEVRRPGVYRLPEGARVTDALKRAGGPTAAAAADAINLAARLADGQQVVVPARAPQTGARAAGGSTGVAAAGGGATAAAGDGTGPISLGTATAADLEAIDGIGPVTAEKIIEYRDSNGGIASIDELDEISGIGPATMETLRESLQP